jgi:ribosomal protein S18 acetylase RimI-like enzyme
MPTADALRYRIAAPRDTDALVALINSAYRGESSRCGWTTEADLLGGQRTDAREITALIGADDGFLLIADTGTDVDPAAGATPASPMLGCLHVQQASAAAWIGMFAIRPGLQGSGLGSRLLGEAEVRSATVWQLRCWRMAVISSRAELLAYYARRGYHDTGERLPFPNDVRFGLPKVAGLGFTVVEKPCPGVRRQP